MDYPDTKPENCRGQKVARPCPYAAQCRYHMFDIIKGDRKYTDDELADILLNLPATCFWDVWEEGVPKSPAYIGKLFRVTGNMISNTTREVLLKDTPTRRSLSVIHDMFHNPNHVEA